MTPPLDGLQESEIQLVQKVEVYVEKYMSQHDSSHDMSHIQRVHKLALHIANASPQKYSLLTIHLAALLHDIGDHKYLVAGNSGQNTAHEILIECGADAQLSSNIQEIVLAVSFSSELRDPQGMQSCLERFPELAVVQDADRLDALGAIGVGRAFTFGAVRGEGMGGVIRHFGEKLGRLEGMMKTVVGREMAVERSRRIRVFGEWWVDEVGGD